MADANFTSAHDAGTGNIHQWRRVDISDAVDQIDSNFATAIAIIDCVSVLTALERVGNQDQSELALGHGFAQGYQTMDDSMPLALTHVHALLRETRGLVNQVQEVRGTQGSPA